MSLHAFLVFWHWFATTHTCDVWQPDPAGNGNHVVYGGDCSQAFGLGRALHAVVTWQGASQGTIHF